MKEFVYLLLFGYVFSTEIIEEGVVYSGSIEQYASQKIKYTSTGGQKQIHYYQCTGSADLTIVDDARQTDVENFRAPITIITPDDSTSITTGCSGGRVFTNCGSPCIPTCDDPHPTCATVCVEDTCECPAIMPLWYGGKCILKNDCPELAEVNKKTVCDKDTPKVECFSAPCMVNKCKNFPLATCSNNYCGGCNAVFTVNGEVVQCDEYSTPDVNKGSPPNWSVGTYEPGNFTFWLLGKTSDNDDVNTYKIYLDNNSNAKYIVVTEDSEIVAKIKPNSTVSISWLEPTTTFTKIVQYCIFHKVLPLTQKLMGEWLACGHEIKSEAESVLCTKGSTAEMENLQMNRSHYFWVVAYGENNSTTAYPFTRVDLTNYGVSGYGSIGLSAVLLLIVLFNY